MTKRALICVFAKPPVPGRVKTRLAAAVGDAQAAALARAFLLDTWSTVSRLTWAKPILATTTGTAQCFGLTEQPPIWLQGEGDLGQRLERILKRGLAEAELVIAIGADSPGLPARLIAEACQELSRTDAVLGPSDDGGFYLIGLRRCPSGLFDALPWSAATTFCAMRERLERQGMTVSTLDAWFDVDRPEDLRRLASMISEGELHAPETARILEACQEPATSSSSGSVLG